MVRFEVKKPTALELCEAYQQSYPTKILGLRSDSLALMLQMSNINYNSRVLLVDNTKGLISGALLEKQVHEVLHVECAGNQIKMKNEIFLDYNFPPYLQKKIAYVHLSNIQMA